MPPFSGVDYPTTAVFSDPNSDLNMWRICGAFPNYASLYPRSDEVGKPVVVFGRGTQRGAEVIVSNILTSSLKGWQWGPSDGVERWGTNLVNSIQTDPTLGDFLECKFDANGGAEEAHLSVGDSGGGVFIKDGAVWKLAGLNYAVDGPYNTTTNGGGFNAVIFDQGGLYHLQGTNWVLTPDVPVDLPGGFYSTRISAHLTWINGIVQASPPADPLPQLSSASIITGPYQNTLAAVDTSTKTVTVPTPSSTQFYRLRACDPSQITSITNSGGMLIISYK